MYIFYKLEDLIVMVSNICSRFCLAIRWFNLWLSYFVIFMYDLTEYKMITTKDKCQYWLRNCHKLR